MKKYDTYKPSGIEWIGEIPSHWGVKKFKYCFDLINEKSDKNTLKVGLENIESWTGKFIETNTEYEGDGEEFRINDILYGKLRPYLAEFDGKAVGDIFIFRGVKKIKPQYGARLILSKNFIEVTNSATFGSKMPRVSWDFIGNLLMPIPEEKEQLAIAKYLNQKTAEIDQLIADKKKLLELYEQEKTTIINQAVTKGINPNAPVKDSGIDWLDEIPEHWEVKRLKYIGKIKYGLGQPPKQKTDGLPIIRATNVFRGKIDEKDLIYVDSDDIPYERDPILKTNDIIVVRSGAYTADSAIIPDKFNGAVTGYDMVLRCHDSINSKFVSYCLLSNYVLNAQLLMQSLRAAQPHLNREELGETILLIPVEREQERIVFFIEKECNRIEAKKRKTEKLIELLTEYRTALISEVVTGKVKVE